MTDKILQEIADRAEAATPGPWTASIGDNDDVAEVSASVGMDADIYGVNSAANAHFIAHARTDIPLLLSELQKARERVEVLETALKPFAVKDLGRQTYGDFDRARQALSPAPVGEEGS